MDVRPIRNEADYDWALSQVEPYFNNEPDPGSPESDRFEVLVALIEDYEARRWPIGLPAPLEAIRHYMDLRGFNQTDLAMALGSRSRASEVLSGKRELTLDQIGRLHAAWGIPVELLIPAKAAA
ncbi:helix-turn-helix domain-containing protein [Roseomonas chloroacetimidivorans]|uniref:helix-turn-helix domain-containing protein n=1 Tax=Roseomonas chloroacetimidivorans TaxID=1766656 RepID=UPI003C7327C5